MPQFDYQIRNAAGQTETGAMTADSLAEASGTLRRDGKIIISLQEHAGAATAAAVHAAPRRKPKRDEVIFFATQLAIMIDTGVPLAEALGDITEQSVDTGLYPILQDVREQVNSGVEFSKALERHPKVFNNLLVSMVRASEATGQMGMMLQRVSRYLRDERDTRKKIKGALTYPACMLTFCLIAVSCLLTFVLPKFAKIYEGKGAVLPAPTRFLLGISQGIQNYWPAVLVVLGGAITGGVFFFRSRTGKMFLDRVRLHSPVLGPMYQKAYLARSLRTLAAMVSAGVGILEALAITAQVAGNYFYAKVWTDAAEGIKEGCMLSDQLQEQNLIPRTVVRMISAGEHSGRMGEVMDRVAGFCEDDLGVAVKTMTNMIEPIMIIVMGLLIGGIAIALLLPIFSISKVVAQ